MHTIQVALEEDLKFLPALDACHLRWVMNTITWLSLMPYKFNGKGMESRECLNTLFLRYSIYPPYLPANCYPTPSIVRQVALLPLFTENWIMGSQTIASRPSPPITYVIIPSSIQFVPCGKGRPRRPGHRSPNNLMNGWEYAEKKGGLIICDLW